MCGVGINVNNLTDGAPEDVATRSVSLLDVTKHAHDRTALLANVMCQLVAEMLALPDSTSDLIARCGTVMVLAGRPVSLEKSGSSVTGKCMGLGTDRGLLVCSAGEIRSYLVGSVVAIEPPLSC